MQSKKIDRVTIASSSLKWIVDELITKINYYTKEHKCRNLVIGGGVSANKLLRKEINSLPVHVHLPIALYSGDNAAMIANYAYLQLTSK
jgi:N6-L-threonylcarbamoyladenine synthase